MLKLNQIQAIHQGMKADVDSLQASLNQLNAQITHIKSDGTRHDSYIKDKVKEARDAAVPTMREKLGTFGSRLETIQDQQRFWSSKPFLLSQQVFDADQTKDATIRQTKHSELTAMDSTLLQLAADSAIDDNNLPLIWQTYLAGHSRTGTPGWRGIDLTDVVVPEQVEALRLIRECEGLAMQAGNIHSEASGSGLTPVRKLQTARALAS